jgi:uncharacterized protein (TIGR02246 family)
MSNIHRENTMRPRILSLLTGVVVVASACDRANEALTEEDIAAVHAVGQDFTRAEVARDLERVVGLHTDDVAWMAPGAPAAIGSDALRKALENGPRPTSFVLTSARTEGSGSVAYDRGTFVYTGVVGTDTVTSRGKYVQVLRRRPDGSWRIAVAIWNEDQPAPPPPPAP